MAETVTGCMLIIGNEILSGRTQDTNLKHLAIELNELGVRMTEARVIPDIEEVIVAAVNECRAKFDYVFTTGGIGPTHDDITADCIAAAFGVRLIMDPTAEAIIRRREAPPDVMEARLRMARVPEGSTLIDNGTGGPPGFQMENVFVMAGVPMVMQAMVASLDAKRIRGGKPVRSRTIGAHLGEGQIAALLRGVQDNHPDVDVGSYPFYRDTGYGTNLVVRGTDEAELDAIVEELRSIIVDLGGNPTDGGL
ncbi:MAG: competence/damage-inducible protein A [Gammaproteobacteria bacterium]|nr:competence/damage-inducible protein A [Gammaproteobacteria bacterium]|tara:strand:+ start:232 stop:984 length:753 start_codon:yes stop_codon:yes gene_type:complete